MLHVINLDYIIHCCSSSYIISIMCIRFGSISHLDKTPYFSLQWELQEYTVDANVANPASTKYLSHLKHKQCIELN